MIDIFIPSKGRPDKVHTYHALLQGNSRRVAIVVEPEELEAYQEAMKGFGVEFLVLPASNQGIAFVRNFILDYAQTHNVPSYWMLDDDIKEFKQYINGKPHKIDGLKALDQAKFALSAVPNLAQGALEYDQYAWSAKNSVRLYGYCDVAVLIYPQRVGAIRYRPEVNLKEDRDFTMQLLHAGKPTARASQISFRAPKNGSNKGGLYDVYREGREKAASDRMIALWPDYCSISPKKDRHDVSIDWRKLALNCPALLK
jgi:hypothetical protein